MTGAWCQSGASERQVSGEECPEDIALQRSYTDAFLKPVLERRENKRKAKIEAAE